MSLAALPRWWIAHAVLLPPLDRFDLDLDDPPELLVWAVRLWGGVFAGLMAVIMVTGHP